MTSSSTARQYLETACRKLPVIQRTIRTFGDASLCEYLEHVTAIDPRSLQPRTDFIDTLKDDIAPLLGNIIADRAAIDVEQTPVVLTANHHGVDYFSHSVQGNLIFSLHRYQDRSIPAIIPVLAGASIPLDNATYPRGMMIYHIDPDQIENVPARLPIFPKKLKSQMVCFAPPVNENMLRSARNRLEEFARCRWLAPGMNETIDDLFQTVYALSSMQSLDNYSMQATIWNHQIWKRLFVDKQRSTTLVFLEIEKIVSKLLQRDLSNPDSLVMSVMFDSDLRNNIINELDGVKLCWTHNALCNAGGKRCGDKPDSLKTGGGTLFFWGVDDKKRKIPLFLDNGMLKGINHHGKRCALSFSAHEICAALQTGRLIPSGFTCFLALAFARGIGCIGGYFQGDYLPAMKDGLIKALRNTAGYQDVADKVARVAADKYLSGMLVVMREMDENHLIPAGPLEIIQHGGISEKDILKMQSITVRNAHLAGLFETVIDIIPPSKRESGWKRRLSREYIELIKDSVVIK